MRETIQFCRQVGGLHVCAALCVFVCEACHCNEIGGVYESVTKNFNIARLDQFKKAEKAKRELVRFYGIASNNHILDKWVANDLRNALKSALLTSAPSLWIKIKNILAVIRTQGFSLTR